MPKSLLIRIKYVKFLGDNLFYGHGLPEMVLRASNLDDGALIFGYQANNPERYGVIEFDDKGNALSIEENL